MPPLRKRTIFLLPLTLLSLILLPGCWNAHELNDEFIILAESIDKVGDQIIITTQLIAPEQSNGDKGAVSQSSSRSKSPFFLLTGQGKSIGEAMKDYRSKSPRYLYGGHLEALFISEEVAKDGIMPYLDLYSRHYWNLDSTWLIITHGPARDMLTLQNPMMKYVTIDLEERVKKRGLKITTLSDFLVNYNSDSGMQVLTNSSIENPTQTKGFEMEGLMVSNTALFRQDQLVGFLSPEEGECYNYFLQNSRRTAFLVKNSPFSPQGKLAVKLSGKPPVIEVIPTEKGPLLSVKVNFEFEVTEDTSNVKTDQKYVSVLEESIDENFSSELKKLIEHTQQEKLDVFNVADRLHAMHPTLWGEVKDNWPEEYSKLPLKIEVTARYRNSSAMTTGPGYKE